MLARWILIALFLSLTAAQGQSNEIVRQPAQPPFAEETRIARKIFFVKLRSKSDVEQDFRSMANLITIQL